jgi:hypothetical protein
LIARILVPSILAAFFASPSAAAAELQNLASLAGTCERLVMAGKDLSAGCSGRIIQSAYDDGRTGFTVLVGDKGVAITWSGIQGAKPDADSQLQSLDRVILNLNIEGVAPTSTSMTGSCAYSNPYKGPMIISCQGMDIEGKAYLLQFRTDGSEPVFMGEDSSGKEVAGDGTFEVGAWTGGPLKDDPDGGCLMSTPINDKITLLVYANANEGFTISFYNELWNFGPEDQPQGELLFDGTTYPLSSIDVRNEHVLSLVGGGEEEGYESLFEESSELVFRTDREQITARLKGSRAATAALWRCVG